MKRIIGMGAAAVIVLLQLAAVAAWHVEPEFHLTPVDGPAAGDERRA